jgi:hypothetical protein
MLNDLLSDDQVTSRAYRAWFIECERQGVIADQPSAASSGQETLKGRNYVVLRNVRGMMAVYRVSNNGSLERLKRWPVELGCE